MYFTVAFEELIELASMNKGLDFLKRAVNISHFLSCNCSGEDAVDFRRKVYDQLTNVTLSVKNCHHFILDKEKKSLPRFYTTFLNLCNMTSKCNKVMPRHVFHCYFGITAETEKFLEEISELDKAIQAILKKLEKAVADLKEGEKLKLDEPPCLKFPVVGEITIEVCDEQLEIWKTKQIAKMSEQQEEEEEESSDESDYESEGESDLEEN